MCGAGIYRRWTVRLKPDTTGVETVRLKLDTTSVETVRLKRTLPALGRRIEERSQDVTEVRDVDAGSVRLEPDRLAACRGRRGAAGRARRASAAAPAAGTARPTAASPATDAS